MRTRKTSRGFSLIAAIFLLVVIAALGAFVVTISTTQQQTSALDVNGSRAYQAARAGIEWGIYQILRGAGATGTLSCSAAGTANAVPMPSAAATFAGFTVSVTCSSRTATEASGGVITSYQLVSTATAGGAPADPNYVERRITVQVVE